MLQRGRGRLGFVNGDFKVRLRAAPDEKLLPDGHGKINRLAVDMQDAAKLLRRKGKRYALAHVKGLLQIACAHLVGNRRTASVAPDML